MLNSLREKFARFMNGRYGVDSFSRMLMYAALVFIIVTFFWRNTIIYGIGLALLIYAYFRAFSRNISKRYAEGQSFEKFKYKIIGKFNNVKFRAKDRKTHKIFKCPNCSQKIRVPKGKGKIAIKCPKCRIEFTRKS